MPPNAEDKGKPAGYTRRRNMKKLNRAGRAKLKKKKEIIAAAEAKGEDVTEALRKAGLVDEQPGKSGKTAKAGNGTDLAPNGTSDEVNASNHGNTEKKAKAKKRIEQLKASKRQKKALESGGHDGPSQQVEWADLLFKSFKSATNHGHRASSGFISSAIHPASPIPITRLEQALTQKETKASGLSVPPTEKAQPRVVFISASAIGALDCLKNCQGLHAACPIAKLFAKHMKVPEQAAYLSEHPVNVVLGTPNRLLKLATEGHLDLSSVGVVVLDMRKNPKRQSMIDIPEVAGDWWKLWEQFFMQRGAKEGTNAVDTVKEKGAVIQLLIVDG